MKKWLKYFPKWILHKVSNTKEVSFPKWTRKCLLILSLIFFGSMSVVQAQSEDTTRTERELPDKVREKEQIPSSARTPYRIDIMQSDINRYQLRDYGSSNRFYRQLEYRSVEDYLMSEEEGYNRYGAEWERKINEDLHAILEATFKEDSEIMKLWKSIAPFLGFGFWEPYEVPITRVEHPDKVPVN